ncbi:MAG: hypothetical protein FRX49_00689 [Trebouxia sp. A1-2]|nr:MAG: hypothetical protein FRX49_00689 [Trebouxia sp. A1-2]
MTGTTANNSAYFSSFSMEYDPGPTSRRDRTAIASEGRLSSLYLLERPIPSRANACDARQQQDMHVRSGGRGLPVRAARSPAYGLGTLLNLRSSHFSAHLCQTTPPVQGSMLDLEAGTLGKGKTKGKARQGRKGKGGQRQGKASPPVQYSMPIV